MNLPNYATQLEGTNDSPEMDVVIGLDFGTSCTKVVVQAPVVRKAFAVPFEEKGHTRNIYLLPSKIGITSDGACQLVGYGQRGLRGLKRGLMVAPSKSFNLKSSPQIKTNALEVASAFVGLLLQYIRRWYLINCGDEYGSKRIRWQLNLGIPAKNYDDERIRRAFSVVARAGWWLSVQKRSLSIQAAKEAMEQAIRDKLYPGIHPELIQVVPEVAAEVAGYARSPLREDGLHAIVDIGANTMDIATFRLQISEEGLEYYFLWAEVSEHACHSLHSCRLENVKGCLNSWFTQLRRVDDLNAEIPNSHNAYSPPQTDLSDIDQEFIENAKRPITRVAAISYTNRDPHAQEWKRGVPLFLCGGGSDLNLFKNELIQGVEKGLKNYNIAGFRIRALPMPENLEAEGLDPRQYHRLAVAYGLSFFFDDIGRTVPPSEITDIRKEERIKVMDYISKDMV